MKIFTFLKNKIVYLFFLVFYSSVFSQITENTTITALYQNSYTLYQDIRNPNGIYIDALALNGAADKPASIVANGVGLIALCIADAMYQKTGDQMHWENNAPALVESTLQTFIDFRNAGKVNSEGLYHRYFDYNTGDLAQGGWTGEYSTMDNAIFTMGVVFCKNYFASHPAIISKANDILDSMHYTKAIGTSQIYMVLNQSGDGEAPTSPFNEYMLVAWLAKNAPATDSNYNAAQTFWNTYFSNPSTASVARVNYWGYETLSDGQHWLSSFIPQFCYYLCNYYKNNTAYMNYFSNSMSIDKLYGQNLGFNAYEWGLGAGEIPGGGYSADAVEKNPNKIISPTIIAGFIPIHTQSKSDLLSLYNNGAGPSVYSLISDPSKKVLWRYRQNNTALRTSYIQAIDFSTMLFGLASLPEYLGENWFNIYNVINNQTLTASKTDVKRKGTIAYSTAGKIIKISNIPGQKHVRIFSPDGRTLLDFLSSEQDVSINANSFGLTAVLVSVSTPNENINKRIMIY